MANPLHFLEGFLVTKANK